MAPIEKAYYTRTEIADLLDESDSTIRFWTDSFNITPRRSGTGRIRYTREHLEELRTIRHLLRECHLTIDGAKATLRQKPQEAERRAKAIATLKEVRDELQMLRLQVEQIERYASASEIRERLKREGL